jgi:hypothetical protein
MFSSSVDTEQFVHLFPIPATKAATTNTECARRKVRILTNVTSLEHSEFVCGRAVFLY